MVRKVVSMYILILYKSYDAFYQINGQDDYSNNYIVGPIIINCHINFLRIFINHLTTHDFFFMRLSLAILATYAKIIALSILFLQFQSYSISAIHSQWLQILYQPVKAISMHFMSSQNPALHESSNILLKLLWSFTYAT